MNQEITTQELVTEETEIQEVEVVTVATVEEDEEDRMRYYEFFQNGSF